MLSLLVLSLLGCKEPPPRIPGELERTGAVLKVVNGQNVTQSMVDGVLAGLPPGTKDQLLAQGRLDQIKERVITDEILYQEAIKQKYHEKADVKAQLALAERQALAGALVKDVIAQRSDDAAVKKYYDEHAVQFQRPQVHARHILVKDEALANEIYKQVKGGADFAALAAEKSTDPGSAKKGGDLGWFEKGRMVKEFAEAAFAANVGDIVGPVKSQFGFHVIKVEEKRDAQPVEEVADKIKSQLQGEIFEAYLEELKKAATITDPAASSTGNATVTAPAGAAPGGAAPAPAGQQAPTGK